jgi:TM2 domain-containing membrane protein YozV
MTMGTYAYPNPHAIFYQQFEAARRDEVVGILLALFLGSFGAHHFYLRRTGLGILYLCFFWSGIPALLGFIECFFMPGRVREFNAIQAAGIAAALGIPVPGWSQPMNMMGIPPGAAPTQAQTMSAQATAPQSAPVQAVALAPVVATPVGVVAATPAMKACPNCQRMIPPEARFCPGCGTAL